MANNIKEIKPNPLITSTVEIRFISDLKEEEVLGVFFKIYGEQFPNITHRGIPKELKQFQPELEFLTDYILSNDDFSISISNKSIAFENIGEYKLWPSYFQTIKECLMLLNSLGVIRSITRIGMRYISLFDVIVPIKESLNLNFVISYNNYQQDSEHFKLRLNKGDISIFLQVSQNAKGIKTETKIEKNGLHLDIDASQIHNLPQTISDELFDNINALHTEEKSLFEFLILDSFLKKLEVKY